MRQLQIHSNSIDKYEHKYGQTYKQETKTIYDNLTKIDVQFKKERTDIKLVKIIETIDTMPVQNVYERRQG